MTTNLEQEIAPRPIDVTGIGNAIVDLIAHEPDALIAELGMIKGAMNLVDAERSAMIVSRLTAPLEVAGGSVANTITGISSLGGRAHYMGKVRDDRLGHAFSRSVGEIGVGFTTPFASSGPATACCAILVTDDAQRTMNTYLGASVDFRPEDVDRKVIASSAILYLEGYLFDPPHAQEAFRVAARHARDVGTLVSITLSDSFCVDRHRDAFLELITGHVDLVFANEHEICSLFETDDVDDATTRLRELGVSGAITHGAKGSTLFRDGEFVTVEAHPVDEVVDTTGAGDLYAAGVLFGWARGYDLETCGRLGSVAAAEVLSHLGARPLVPLSELTAELIPA